MDGVSVCVQNYAYWLQKKVGGVQVITPSASGADYSVYDYKVVDFMSVPAPFRPPYVTGVAELDPHFLADILKTRFKIVHAHSPFATGLAAQRVASIQHIPIVATFHSKYRDDFSRIIKSERVVDSIIKRIVSFYEKCDEVWVPQESVKDVIRECGFKGNVEVVDNGCDFVADYPDSYFEESRLKLGIAPDEFVMLFVGQHIWEKNIRFILEGLEKVKALPFRMFFVGEGYAAEEMKHIVYDDYDDYALLTFSLESPMSMDEVLECLEDQTELNILYHVSGIGAAPGSQHCCAYASPAYSLGGSPTSPCSRRLIPFCASGRRKPVPGRRGRSIWCTALFMQLYNIIPRKFAGVPIILHI